MSYLDAMTRISEIQSSALLSPAAYLTPAPPTSGATVADEATFQQHMDRATQPTTASRSAAATEATRAGAPLSADVERLITASADRHGIDRNVVRAVVRAESNGQQDVVSPAGAVGLMQLMPQTAKGLDVDPHVAAENVDGGVRYLKQMLEKFDGDVRLAIAGYNAGPGAVDRYNGIPPYRETQQYVAKIASELGL